MDQVQVFISHAHEDAELVRTLAAELESRNFRVWVDEGEMRVGDSLIERISTAIRDSEFVVAVVSAASVDSRWCQKELSLAITGELQREGVKVLPLRVDDIDMPPALVDVFHLDLRRSDVPGAADKLSRDIRSHHGEREVVQRERPERERQAVERDEPIHIVGLVEEGVGQPRNDGTAGSALYRVPLRLNRRPSPLWAQLFPSVWDRPPEFTTMHRPGIARVIGDTIVLDGTTIDELEKYHVRTLGLVVDKLNQDVARLEAAERTRHEQEGAERQRHEQEVRDAARRLAAQFEGEPNWETTCEAIPASRSEAFGRGVLLTIQGKEVDPVDLRCVVTDPTGARHQCVAGSGFGRPPPTDNLMGHFPGEFRPGLEEPWPEGEYVVLWTGDTVDLAMNMKTLRLGERRFRYVDDEIRCT